MSHLMTLFKAIRELFFEYLKTNDEKFLREAADKNPDVQDTHTKQYTIDGADYEVRLTVYIRKIRDPFKKEE